MAKTKQKRGALRGESAERVSIPIPKSWKTHIDAAVKTEDTDRSKLMRNALRHHFSTRFGITLPAT